LNFLSQLNEKIEAINKYCFEHKNFINKLINKLLLTLGVFMLFYMGIYFLAKFYGIGVIRTQSIDKEIMIYERNIKESIGNDSLIYFSLPVQTAYFNKGEKFAKFVRCKEGDVLTTKNLEYFCNDKFLGIAKTSDKNGKKVKPFVFNGIIAKDKFFVMGTHERSFDSRYWGFVDIKDIKGVSLWAM